MADVEMKPGPDGGYRSSGPSEERNWSMACHLSAFAGYLLPFGHILGPLAVWLWKGRLFPRVDEQGREALNFQLSITIYFLGAWLLAVVGIGFLLMIALSLFDFIAIIVAAVKTYRGEDFRYPLCIRFFK